MGTHTTDFNTGEREKQLGNFKMNELEKQLGNFKAIADEQMHDIKLDEQARQKIIDACLNSSPIANVAKKRSVSRRMMMSLAPIAAAMLITAAILLRGAATRSGAGQAPEMLKISHTPMITDAAEPYEYEVYEESVVEDDQIDISQTPFDRAALDAETMPPIVETSPEPTQPEPIQTADETTPEPTDAPQKTKKPAAKDTAAPKAPRPQVILMATDEPRPESTEEEGPAATDVPEAETEEDYGLPLDDEDEAMLSQPQEFVMLMNDPELFVDPEISGDVDDLNEAEPVNEVAQFSADEGDETRGPKVLIEIGETYSYSTVKEACAAGFALSEPSYVPSGMSLSSIDIYVDSRYGPQFDYKYTGNGAILHVKSLISLPTSDVEVDLGANIGYLQTDGDTVTITWEDVDGPWMILYTSSEGNREDVAISIAKHIAKS